VKIDLHHQLLTLRGEIAKQGQLPISKRWGMKLAGKMLGSAFLYSAAGKIARALVPRLPRFLVYNRLNPWGKQRELPDFPQQSFREWFRGRHEK